MPILILRTGRQSQICLWFASLPITIRKTRERSSKSANNVKLAERSKVAVRQRQEAAVYLNVCKMKLTCSVLAVDDSHGAGVVEGAHVALRVAGAQRLLGGHARRQGGTLGRLFVAVLSASWARHQQQQPCRHIQHTLRQHNITRPQAKGSTPLPVFCPQAGHGREKYVMWYIETSRFVRMSVE